jgi:hypothetical protein
VTVYLVVKNYRAGRRWWDGWAWREDRAKAKLYETPELAYAARCKLGLSKTSIISEAGAEIAELDVHVCPDCGRVRIVR